MLTSVAVKFIDNLFVIGAAAMLMIIVRGSLTLTAELTAAKTFVKSKCVFKYWESYRVGPVVYDRSIKLRGVAR